MTHTATALPLRAPAPLRIYFPANDEYVVIDRTTEGFTATCEGCEERGKGNTMLEAIADLSRQVEWADCFI